MSIEIIKIIAEKTLQQPELTLQVDQAAQQHGKASTAIHPDLLLSRSLDALRSR